MVGEHTSGASVEFGVGAAVGRDGGITDVSPVVCEEFVGKGRRGMAGLKGRVVLPGEAKAGGNMEESSGEFVLITGISGGSRVGIKGVPGGGGRSEGRSGVGV